MYLSLHFLAKSISLKFKNQQNENLFPFSPSLSASEQHQEFKVPFLQLWWRRKFKPRKQKHLVKCNKKCHWADIVIILYNWFQLRMIKLLYCNFLQNCHFCKTSVLCFKRAKISASGHLWTNLWKIKRLLQITQFCLKFKLF